MTPYADEDVLHTLLQQQSQSHDLRYAKHQFPNVQLVTLMVTSVSVCLRKQIFNVKIRFRHAKPRK